MSQEPRRTNRRAAETAQNSSISTVVHGLSRQGDKQFPQRLAFVGAPAGVARRAIELDRGSARLFVYASDLSENRCAYVDGPLLASALAECGSDRLRSYVRSVVAVAHDRCQDGFRNTSSKHFCGIAAPLRSTECLASRIDRSHHLLLLMQVPELPRGECGPSGKDYAAWSNADPAVGCSVCPASARLPS
jgi:hypothetical protein